MAVLLTANNLAKAFGAKTLFEGISLSVHDRERLALIGPNGSGKSTLLRILAGDNIADEGGVTVRKGVRAAYVPQRDEFPEGATIHSAVADALKADMASGTLAHLHDDHEADLAADLILDRVGFLDLSVPASSLSGGQRKRLAIARELAKEPDVLLLDEPTNHLDVEGIEWLEGVLRAGPFASVIVTHDREFLETVATRIAELSRQYPQGLFAIDGDYSEFLRRKQEFLDGQARQEQALANQVREDLRWLGRGAKARRTKSKSRIDASHERMAELASLRERNASVRAAAIDWEATGRMTQKLVVARAITKSLGGKPLFTDLDLVLSPGHKLGLLGPNGSGKSTLIRVLTGEIEPDPPTPEALAEAERAVNLPPGLPPPGTIRRADRLRTVVFSQHRTEIDPSITLAEALSPHADAVIYRGASLHINTWARKFLFTSQQLKQPVRSLSGGEQARIHIARLMLEPADVLVLDEPTNDLDIPSLEVLEESLEEFPGALILVTHDRAMLARLSTHIIALDGEGRASHFVDYEQWERAHELARASRKADRAASAPAAQQPAVSQPATQPPATQKKKLSYKEQRELADIEPEIHKAEALAAEMEKQMNDPAVIADFRKFEEISRAFAAAQERVTQLFERWQELEARS
ncbi:MAG: ABC-F family ATP-binding cassette domain-containing protein [Phycisphaerales bacterium]|nr:ABC-F family ATP-binding cassette domain-containing protein [Planctomycetota bacterium]